MAALTESTIRDSCSGAVRHMLRDSVHDGTGTRGVYFPCLHNCVCRGKPRFCFGTITVRCWTWSENSSPLSVVKHSHAIMRVQCGDLAAGADGQPGRTDRSKQCRDTLHSLSGMCQTGGQHLHSFAQIPANTDRCSCLLAAVCCTPE